MTVDASKNTTPITVTIKNDTKDVNTETNMPKKNTVVELRLILPTTVVIKEKVRYRNEVWLKTT